LLDPPKSELAFIYTTIFPLSNAGPENVIFPYVTISSYRVEHPSKWTHPEEADTWRESVPLEYNLTPGPIYNSNLEVPVNTGQ